MAYCDHFRSTGDWLTSKISAVLSGLQTKGDVSDFLEERIRNKPPDETPEAFRERIKDEILAIVEATPEYQPPSPESGAVKEQEVEAPKCTDLGNALRFAKMHSRSAKHSNALGWLIWDGKRWKRERTQEVRRLA